MLGQIVKSAQHSQLGVNFSSIQHSEVTIAPRGDWALLKTWPVASCYPRACCHIFLVYHCFAWTSFILWSSFNYKWDFFTWFQIKCLVPISPACVREKTARCQSSWSCALNTSKNMVGWKCSSLGFYLQISESVSNFGSLILILLVSKWLVTEYCEVWGL